MMQCWECCHVQSGRIRHCDECGSSIEVLYSVNDRGEKVFWPLDVKEYERRLDYNPLKR